MTEHQHATPYRVLARKYRPASFAGLIGQDAMVRILTNAIASGRLAHAFMLTGVRGVGKTTTARIIARTLNCVGPDGTGGPTAEPCGQCEHCIAIAEDRHVDVIEMDAASRTGVDDIRELIEGVRYRPVSARYKVYIIDEVHMLSKPAFNALLKTLEEPPEHVKFIFATTEIRKVPVTVLSRCQRFDLRRVDGETLAAHLRMVADKEGAEIGPEALRLIARAADGSVRDALSLLDTAIAHGAHDGAGGGAGDGESGTGGTGGISQAQLRVMLGLADRSRVFDLFGHLVRGEAAPALNILDDLYGAGADPAVVMQDLLEFCHMLMRLKVVPGEAPGADLEAEERARAKEMAEKLSVPVLARLWQMLLKGLTETQSAPSPIAAAQMVLVRLAYAADLPVPAELVSRLTRTDARPPEIDSRTGPGPDAGPDVGGGGVGPSGGGANAGANAGGGAASEPPPRPHVSPSDGPSGSGPSGSGPGPSSGSGPDPDPDSSGTRPRAVMAGAPVSAPAPAAAPATAPATAPAAAALAGPAPEAASGDTDAGPQSFDEVMTLLTARREAILRAHLVADVHLVRFEPGRIEFRPGPHAPANLANRLGQCLGRFTGRRWVVSVSGEAGAPTLKEQAVAAEAKARQAAAAHPAVRAVLDAFPGATIAAVREVDGADTADNADTAADAAAEGGPTDTPEGDQQR